MTDSAFKSQITFEYSDEEFKGSEHRPIDAVKGRDALHEALCRAIHEGCEDSIAWLDRNICNIT